MFKKTVTYIDYDGEERTEDFFFNLTDAEITKFQLSVPGGVEKMIRDIVAAKDHPKIVEMFDKLVLMSYGVKSPDGRRFIKNDAVREEFTQTEAYSAIFMEFATNAEAAAAFVNGIINKKK